MNLALRLSLLAFSLALMFDSKDFGQTADTIYHNGFILTMAGVEPTYVEALAVKDGKIAFAGSKNTALKMKGDATKIVDLGGPEQASKGTLEAGKRADLVILDKDRLKVDPKAIKDIKVVETIEDGVTIFPAPASFEKPLKAPSKYACMSYMWRAHVCDMAEVNQAARKEWILVSPATAARSSGL